ncbi:MAG: tetratricopeptide repeat protein [Candidatus Aminicenantes bacterium]|nr:tetratricopeptide repeat protein [Candidatus Aminicenantes bacterium]
MIKITSIKQRNRLLRLLLAAVVLPGIIISAVSTAAVSRQKKARQLRVEEKYRNLTAGVRKEIESETETLTRKAFAAASRKEIEFIQPGAVQKALKEILLQNPIVKYPFIIAPGGQFIFPIPKKVGPTLFKISQVNLYKGAAGKIFRQGEDAELRERKFYSAVKFYLQTLKKNPAKNTIPYIYNSIARCYYKLNKFPQAIDYLKDLLRNFPGQLKKDFSLYFQALYQTALAYKSMGAKEETLNSFLLLYDEILQYEVSGGKNRFSFFKDEALEYLNRHIKETDRESQKPYREKVLDRLGGLSDIDISLNWSFFDAGLPTEETGAGTKKNAGDEIRFNKIREFYLSNNEKSRFYRRIKGLEEWRDSNSHDLQLRRIGNADIAFIKIITGSRNRNALFFGFLISPDFIENSIFPAAAAKGLGSADLRLSILNNRSTAKDIAPRRWMFSTSFRNYLPGKILVLSSRRAGYLKKIVQKEIWLNYGLIFALISALIFGIFFFYKYISKEVELVQAKAAFVDSASHTLKTPLTRIRMLAEKLELGWIKDETKKKEYFRTITAETDRMTGMIENMLDFSKIEGGKKEYERKKLAIQEVIAPVIESFKKQTKSLEFSRHVEIDEDIPPFFFDPEAIKLILVNLIQNAVKYSPGEKHIGIRLYRDGDRVVLYVEDRGMGIEQKELGKIFSRFYRAPGDRVKALEGSGLGLFLVAHAIEAHGGEIEVESEVGAGTVFRIYLPLSKDNNKKFLRRCRGQYFQKAPPARRRQIT